MTPEAALELAEAQRALIRSWDLQRRERADPQAETVTDEQVDQSVTLLEGLAEYLPTDDRNDIERLIGVVRIRLELKAEQ